jgi:signal transduction histidine kinase
LYKVEGYQKYKPNSFPEHDSARRALVLTTGFGGIFGLLITIIIASMYGFPAPFLLYIAGIPIFCALIAGLVGVTSVYINRVLIKIGIVIPTVRQIIEVIVAVSIVITIGLSCTAFLGFMSFKEKLPLIATTSTTGFILGLIVSMVDYRLWKMRKQVLALEIENKYLAELAEKEQQLRETTKNLIITQERNRLARELHDSISQGIHGIIYAVHSLRQYLGAEDKKVLEILNHLEKTSDATLNELRAMILELKPSLLEERGLAETLKVHCELFAQRLKVQFQMQMERITGLSPEQEMAVYRVVQEALANIQKHSTADQIFISLTAENNNQVKLIIKDNGKGFNLELIKRGNGLDNMEIRCRENSGTFRIIAKPGAGTCIEAVFAIAR